MRARNAVGALMLVIPFGALLGLFVGEALPEGWKLVTEHPWEMLQAVCIVSGSIGYVALAAWLLGARRRG